MSPATSLRTPSERLYARLPAIYRLRDVAQGEPLRALLSVLEDELLLIESDIARLYDNWFIETCDEWAVPYLGDLIGARLRHAVNARAFTANTLAYRRRKGTLATLPALGRDVTGWAAHAVEYQSLVVTSQHVSSPRPRSVATASLHQLDALDRIGTPLEQTQRTVDVRSRGRFHPDQLGLYVFRSSVLSQQRAVALPATELAGCFFVSPLGQPHSLWCRARSRPGLLQSAEPGLLPQPIRRRELFRLLEQKRQALIDGRVVTDPYFGTEPVFRVSLLDDSGRLMEVPPEQMVAANLSSLWRPPARLSYRRGRDGKLVELPVTLAVDPELGRLAFAEGLSPRKVWVTYHYGATAELGGGGYPRRRCVADSERWVTAKDGDSQSVLGKLADVTTATALWQGGQQLVIELADSDFYSLGSLVVPTGLSLTLRAASGQRPVLTAPQAVVTASLGAGSTLVIDGLLLSASVSVGALAGTATSASATVRIQHATLVPGVTLDATGQPTKPQALALSGPTQDGSLSLSVELDRSICGPIQLGSGCRLSAIDSIVDSPGSLAALRAPAASLRQVTVLGQTTVTRLTDTVNCLFWGTVQTTSSVEGDISYSYLPYRSGDAVPYRCQPHLSLEESVGSEDAVLRAVRPQLMSRRYGSLGYGQLDVRSHSAIRSVASDQGEPGALHHLQQALRESNLLDSQAEYLRSNLTLNLFVVT